MTMKNIYELKHEYQELETNARLIVDRANGADLEGRDAEEFDAATKRMGEVCAAVENIEARAEALKQFAIDNPRCIERGDAPQGPNSDWRNTGNTTRDQAMRTLERSVRAGDLPEHAATRVETIVKRGDSWAARWAVATGNPDYATAFTKLAADPERGHMFWTQQEQRAFQAVEQVKAEQRAMSSAGSAGGFLVPLHLDPSILLTNDGSINPLRRISRVVQITGSSWNGVTSAGASAEWIAEAAQVADASPVLAQPNVPVFKGDSFVPYSFEVGDDGQNFLAELQTLLVDAADQLMATAYTTGTGSGQPSGLITGLAGTASEINGGTAEALGAADTYTLQNALPPRFQPRAQWMANLSILNTLRQFETSNGALKFPGLQNNPPSLLGRTVHENSNMDGAINAAATANNYVLVYGDFQQFLIVDRIGTRIEFIENLMGANQRPTGQRGALLWFRTGSEVLVPEAFELLDIPTTA